MLGAPVFRSALYGPWNRNPLWAAATALPSLDLRFADSKSLADATTGANLVTFTRASSGTYVGSNGVLQTATNDVPRFDHNPTTGESLGLLVEEQRTNLLLRSEEFDNASWSKTACSVTANVHSSPSGQVTADKIVENNTTAQRYVSQSSSVTTGVQTLSFYAKGDGRTIAIFYADNGNVAQGFVLISNGSLQGNFGASAPTSATIQAVGNGWYRCSATWTTVAGSTQIRIYPAADTSSPVYQGDGTSGLFIWGAQLEAGAFPTSYIPTTTATATRSADVASITGANFSSWYNSSASTLYSEAQSASGSAYTGYVYTLGADFNNAITHYRQSDFQPVARIRNAGVDEYGANGNGAIWTGTSVNKFALAISPTSGRQASNGSLNSSGDDSSITAPSASSMTLGALVGTSILLNGTIRRLVYWGQRLPNNVLQTITQ